METKQVKAARAYIEDQVKFFHDVSDIAWKFLLGNSILEQLEKLGFTANQSYEWEIKKLSTNGDNSDVHLTISKTPEANGSGETPLNQPNSSEDLGH